MTGSPGSEGDVLTEGIGAKPRSSRLDWSLRSRTTISDAERYTRFVGVMKRTLFAAALLLLGAVVVYSLQPGQQQRMAMTFEKMGMVAGDLAMIKPKLNGLDDEGNPFVVTADTAVQNPKNLRQAALKNVEADVNLKDGRWLNLTSPHGELDSDAKTLNLWGAISVFSDDGDEMHTNLASIDLVRGVVVGPHHVTGQGPQGTYEADRFRIERLSDPCNRTKTSAVSGHPLKPKHPGRKPEAICPVKVAGLPVQKTKPLIFLMGNVHMTFYPNSSKQNKSKSPSQKE